MLIALPVGIISATHRNSIADYASLTAAMIGVSMPSFWLGLLLLLQFGLAWKVLPIWGVGSLSEGLWNFISHLILPSVTMGTGLAALLARLTRASILEVLTQDYILTAKAKGLSTFRVLRDHALKNAMLPMVTMIALTFGYTVGGAIQVETVFSWPGLGRLMYEAVQKRDYPVLQGAFLLLAVSVIVANLLAEILYSVLDPRVKPE